MKRAILFFVTVLFLIGTAYSETGRNVKVTPKKNTSTSQSKHPSGNFALIIGNNNYQYLNKLKTPRNDAHAVDDLLRNRFGFQTKVLLDATRTELLESLNEFRARLGANDNLLIYYAGHGEYDKEVDKAYWLPVDAKRDSPTNWIIADEITSNIKRIASKHILIVSDSCYSGTLTRESLTDLIRTGVREEYMKKMMERPSRTLMASGGNEPVTDSGGGNNSVFALAFLKALKEREEGNFTAEELFYSRVKEIVAGKASQVPEYKTINNSGHEGGDFVFQFAKGTVIQEEEKPVISKQEEETGTLLIKSNVDGAKIYLDDKYEDETPIKVNNIKPGTYIITLKKDGYITAKDTVTVSRGKEVTVSMMLEKVTEEAEAPAPRVEKKTEPAYETGKTYTDPATGIEVVFVKGGCYQMGDTFGDDREAEKPVHEVCVDDFWMSKYEVTQGQWKAIMGNNPSYFKDCGDNCPVEQVSWIDVQEYVQKLNEKITPLNPPLYKGGYRLPTEAEWEYAARSGGKKEKWAGTSNESELGEYVWYTYNSANKTHSVGQKNPNGLGLCDMSGNVWEWVQDWYNKDAYSKHSRNNPIYDVSGGRRVIRGGSWNIAPQYVRSANRSNSHPSDRVSGIGIRLLRTP
jgi:formylglycine-generating enzyme required for sulfatase activity